MYTFERFRDETVNRQEFKSLTGARWLCELAEPVAASLDRRTFYLRFHPKTPGNPPDTRQLELRTSFAAFKDSPSGRYTGCLKLLVACFLDTDEKDGMRELFAP